MIVTPSLFFCCNAAYWRPALVAITSAARFLPQNTPVEISLVTEGITAQRLEDLRLLLKSINSKLVLRAHPFNQDLFSGTRDPGYLSMMAYARMMVDRLPFESDRVLFLDSDTMVRGPLAPLWNVDLKDNICAAVRDRAEKVFPDRLDPHITRAKSIGKPGYFNSGVMLIDRKAWKSASVTDRTIKFLRSHPDLCPYADQCALNVTLAGRWLEIEGDWNFQNAQYGEGGAPRLEKAAIIHFLGNRKPWNPVFSRTPAACEYFKTARKVGIKGWRPSYTKFLIAWIKRNAPGWGYHLQRMRKRLIH